ncbi:MAG TPA: hypothetical protein PLN85_00170 [archaeon]|nr:hypothetical protein [archaeon]
MKIFEKHIEIIKFLVNNININDFFIAGGIADYYHFNKLGYDTNLVVGDVDIVIFKKKTFNEIKSLFSNVKIKLFEEHSLFYLNDNLILDVFFNKNNQEMELVDCFNMEFNIETIDSRIKLLNNFTNNLLDKKPMYRKNLKYLKKLVYYGL